MSINSQAARLIRDKLEEMTMPELRQAASKQYGIKLLREWTKEDIIDQIVAHMSKGEFAQIAKGDNRPEPGWARIRLMPQAGQGNIPVYLSLNGYEIYIPWNVQVDVPIKVVGVLQDAIESRPENEGEGADIHRVDRETQSYVYTELMRTDGPDPRPGMETVREKKLAAKREFSEKYGFWPKDSDIKEARQQAYLAKAISGN